MTDQVVPLDCNSAHFPAPDRIDVVATDPSIGVMFADAEVTVPAKFITIFSMRPVYKAADGNVNTDAVVFWIIE